MCFSEWTGVICSSRVNEGYNQDEICLISALFICQPLFKKTSEYIADMYVDIYPQLSIYCIVL